MTTKTMAVLMNVIIPISGYDCLYVRPQTANYVMTAPL